MLTGVQLEVGDTETEFEHRSFGEELQLCQRYYHQLGTESDAEMMGLGVNFGTGSAYFGQYYPVEMRATPTISVNGHANFRCHSDNGGGITGQVEAIRLAISRALCQHDPENRSTLKVEGLMSRDPRMVERKKPGQKKARKKFQFSKR